MEKIVLELFEKLNNEVVKYNPYYDKELLNTAFLYACAAHKGHFRLSGEPYVTHSLHTALKLTKIEADDVSLISALLHDVLDNTSYKLENIKDNFGEEVAIIVDGVSQLGNLGYKVDMTKKEIDEVKSKIVTIGNDIRIFLVKIADRYHNLETLDYVKKAEERFKVAKEAQDVFLPIVNFLSIGEFITDMYDLCFKFTNEKEYNKLNKLFGKKMEYYEEKIISTHNLISQELQRYGINVLKIEGRVKTLNSIFKKLQKKNLNLSQIYDVLALRIVVKNLSECYLVLGIIHRIYKAKTDRFKDYISSPKNNGYQSIHTTVYDLHGDFLEFQIQTEEMYKLNKTGLAAHFIYKGFGVDYNRLPKWMVETLNIQKKTLDSKKFLEKLNQEVIISEIKVFDKTGNRYILPKESVLIDYAFSVNYDSGKYFNGAYINGVFINDPFYKLSSGDFINLLELSDKIFMDYKVENFFEVKTKKAKEAMKTLFSKYSKVKLKNLGKYMLNNTLEIYGLRHFYYQPRKIIEKTFKEFGVKTDEQLYLFIGIESIDYNDVSNFILSNTSKLDFKTEVQLKLQTKFYDYTMLNNITKILYNLNVDLIRISYNKNKNYINLKLKIKNKKDLENVTSEIKRAPSILNVTRVFPLRLKLFYITFIITFLFTGIISFFLTFFLLHHNYSDFWMILILVSNILLFLSFIFILRYFVRKIFPDIIRYKRFYVSLALINTFIFIMLIYFYKFFGYPFIILPSLFVSIMIYLRLYYNYTNIKKVYLKNKSEY